MEALRSDSVHTTDSIRSLSRINAHHIDELSKEKEDELLYGGDDVDEEDVLSDDSMRLRLSDDDEAEPDDILTSVLDKKGDKPEIMKMEMAHGKNEDARASAVPDKNETKNDTTRSRERREEEHCTDANISSRTEADISIKDESCAVKNEIEMNGELVEKTPIASEQNNDDSSKSSIEILEDNNIGDLKKGIVTDTDRVNDSTELENETRNAQGNSENLSGAECKDNDAKSKDNDAESKDNLSTKTDTVNESSDKEIKSPLTTLQNETKEDNAKKEDTDTGNQELDCNGSQSSSNFNILAKLLTNSHKSSFDDEDVEFIEADNENNKKDNATVKLDLDENKETEETCQAKDNEVTTDQQCIEIMETIEVVENQPLEESTKNNDELVIVEKATSREEFLDTNNTSTQDTESNEIVETHASKTDDATLEDPSNREGNKETKAKENDTIVEPLVNGETCDKDGYNYSDNSTNSKLLELLISNDQPSNTKLQEQNGSFTEGNVKTVNKESPIINCSAQTENKVSTLDETDLSSVDLQNDSLSLATKVNNSDVSEKKVEVPVNTHRRRRRTKKMIAAAQEAASEEDKQVKEIGRQKRKTAKNAEEIIRKKFLNHDSDLESSDSSEKFVIINHKVNQDARSLSPPSLKRSCPDLENIIKNGSVKKIKRNNDSLSDELSSKENDPENIKQLDYVNKFFQRDLKEKLPKLKQEELEELLIQKIVETITMRDEIGKLREQARLSERNQEVTRAKCQQLAKQIKDFEMVLSRNAADRRVNNDKPVPPIKINRSVGLQVNFITDHGMQCLRQLQQNTGIKAVSVQSNTSTPLSTSATPEAPLNVSTSPRRGVKVRPPRRIETVAASSVTVSQSHTQSTNVMPTVTPAALVVAKPMEAQHTLQLPTQSNVQQMISSTPLPPQQPQQTIVLNGKFSNQLSRQNTTVNIAKPRTNDLIDLTDEEEKSKGTTSTPVVTNTITEQQISLAQKTQTCFQRVIQTIPGNVAITNSPPNIRVVQPASQPTPTALVNNMNAPRLAYVMQSGVGTTRLLQIAAPNSATIRPVTSCNRTSFPTLTYKTGISTVANGTVRVLTTAAPSNIQLNKHPAPLPDSRNYAMNNPAWKLPPPAPSLKISKVANGIVLSWNMNLSDKYADIVSYQLYAYQEVAGIAPTTSLWKKVGDVRALPLPMACTLTQFSEGNNYYFAVRAVDTHSRKGQYSTPGNISL